jgi:hypothetical protein
VGVVRNSEVECVREVPCHPASEAMRDLWKRECTLRTKKPVPVSRALHATG